MASAIYNDKLNVFIAVFMHTWRSRNLSQQEAIHFLVAMNLASIDTYIGVWKQKYDFDAVRPFTAIAHVYQEKLIKGRNRNI